MRPLDNFHSDELRAELAYRDSLTEAAVKTMEAKFKTDIPSPDNASDIEALTAASGLTPFDAATVLNNLIKSGWVLRPLREKL